jgi:hypothetical protein
MIDNYNFEQSKRKKIYLMNFIFFFRLNSGWSFHTGRPATRSSSATPTNRFGSAAAAATNSNQSLRDEEMERIKKVLERAQRIELIEQERVGYD